MLTYLSTRFSVTKIHLLCWRDLNSTSFAATTQSRAGTITLSALPPHAMRTRPAASGWERNTAGKLGPRLADLGPILDPKRCALCLIPSTVINRWTQIGQSSGRLEPQAHAVAHHA